MALKPIPKLILIVAAVAGVGYAAMKFLPDSKPAAPVAQAETPTVVTPPTAQEQATAKAAPAPVVDTPAPAPAPVDNGGLKPAGGHDAGLDAVLKAGKR